MDLTQPTPTPSAVPAPAPALMSRLQRLARPQRPEQRCELCSAIIAHEHPHLLELKARQIRCACDACAILFGGHESQRYRRISPRIVRVDDIELGDQLWDNLHIPIKLAFFYHHSEAQRVIAMYPSPAGATESLLPMDAWDQLKAQSATVRAMQSDTEALLINQVGKRRDCLLVSIDHCYRLVGLIRLNWRGLSGGLEVWKVVEGFFDDLHHQAVGTGGNRHA